MIYTVFCVCHLFSEIRWERETRRKHRHKHLASVSFGRRRRQQRSHRLHSERTVQSCRSWIFRNTTRIGVDSAKETARRKYPTILESRQMSCPVNCNWRLMISWREWLIMDENTGGIRRVAAKEHPTTYVCNGQREWKCMSLALQLFFSSSYYCSRCSVNW